MIYIKLLGTFFTIMVSFVLLFRPDLAWERGHSLAWLRRYLPDERTETWDRRITIVGLLVFGVSIAILLTLPNGLGVLVSLMYLPFVIWLFS